MCCLSMGNQGNGDSKTDRHVFITFTRVQLYLAYQTMHKFLYGKKHKTEACMNGANMF